MMKLLDLRDEADGVRNHTQNPPLTNKINDEPRQL